jgi:hypothetical protein
MQSEQMITPPRQEYARIEFVYAVVGKTRVKISPWVQELYVQGPEIFRGAEEQLRPGTIFRERIVPKDSKMFAEYLSRVDAHLKTSSDISEQTKKDGSVLTKVEIEIIDGYREASDFLHAADSIAILEMPKAR